MRRVARSSEMSETRAGSGDLATFTRTFRQWANLREQHASLGKRIDDLRELLMDYADKHGEENHKGHKVVELPEEITTPSGKSYSGCVREKRSSHQINLERARELAEQKGLVDQLYHQQVIEVFDQDALYAAQQEGVVTTDELDGLIENTTTFALKGL